MYRELCTREKKRIKNKRIGKVMLERERERERERESEWEKKEVREKCA